jgi:hypothetical protein
MNNDFISSSHEMTNKFYKVLYEMFPFYMDLYGTLCYVERLERIKNINPSLPDRDQMINQVYGKVASKDDYDSTSKVIKFQEKFIIDKTSEINYYNNQEEPITIYYNKNILDLGDKLYFERFGKKYSFVVDEFKSYEDIIFSYNLIGIKDYVVNTKNNW